MSRKPKATVHRFAAILERSTNRLWGGHVSVPGRIARLLAGKQDRRVVCTLNGAAEYQCALLPHGGGTFVISVNKKLREGLGLAFGGEVEVELRRDESRYGHPMPAELSELFRQESESKTLFHALTNGRQRTLLYIINSAKDPDKRIARALAIVRHIKKNNGTIDFKELGTALKETGRASPRTIRKGFIP